MAPKANRHQLHKNQRHHGAALAKVARAVGMIAALTGAISAQDAAANDLYTKPKVMDWSTPAIQAPMPRQSVTTLPPPKAVPRSAPVGVAPVRAEPTAVSAPPASQAPVVPPATGVVWPEAPAARAPARRSVDRLFEFQAAGMARGAPQYISGRDAAVLYRRFLDERAKQSKNGSDTASGRTTPASTAGGN